MHPLATNRPLDLLATYRKEKEGRLRSFDCLLDRSAAKKDREGGKRPNEMMAACDSFQKKKKKARGKWQ